MTRLVVLKLNGTLQQGFHVTVEVAQDGHYPALCEEGELPSNQELSGALAQWQETYARLAQPARAIKPYEIHYDGVIQPLDACLESADCLIQIFQRWLRSDSFLDIEMQLRRVLAPSDVIRVVIRSPDRQLHRLPWHQWSFIDDYPKAEIAMGSARFERAVEELPWKPSMTPKVTILAVLGDRHDIDVESDRKLLNALPGARVTLLVEPTPQQLNEQLYRNSWDILFFAGHSDTAKTGQGIIRLNPTTTLTMEELKYAIRQAIANGLQLAIFNSCNGLGLAHALGELQLPQMIVMREAVPDHVAQSFLKYFLEAFSKGLPLYQAGRQAREQLQGMEKTYPCASWLPLIYQHPGRTPPSWRNLQRLSLSEATLPKAQPEKPQRRAVPRAALTSFVATCLVMGVRFLGGLQPLEFWASDGLMPLRPAEGPDNRMVLVTVDQSDLNYQDERGFDRNGPLSSRALTAVRRKLEPHDPAIVGVAIFRDRPLLRALTSIAGSTPGSEAAASSASDSPSPKTKAVPSSITTFICQIYTGDSFPTISPPTGVDLAHVGFSNIVYDPDQRVRRQPIAMTPDPDCNTDRSFSYQIASSYLKRTSDIEIALRRGVLDLNGVKIPMLERHDGPYHRGNMGGQSILLNYRDTKTIAPAISLTALLEGELDETLTDLVRDRIVLIGSTTRRYSDYPLTPYGEMSEVEIQAHMISQLISAVENGRPLLQVLPQWGDVLWVYAWALGVGTAMILVCTRRQAILMPVVALSGVGAVCFFGLNVGWQLPFVPAAIACAAVCIETPYSYILEDLFTT